MTHQPAMSKMLNSETKPEKPKLYAARQKVYARRVMGTYRRIKWALLIFTLSVYYMAPWLRWERGPGVPNQAILIDMEGRKAYFFFIEIWPQDIYLLTGLLVLAALTLFFVTSLAGRLWCAYACPQTVWTDLFMWIERKVEGDAAKRRKIDAGPRTPLVVSRKILKHSIWMLIGLATGGAWIFYFQDAPTALPEVLTGQSGTSTYFFIGLFTATTYLLGGWAREQVCTYMCPWPRFQAAMFDEDTLVVSYQGWRGEPRSRHQKKAEAAGQKTGDCVDCGWCVDVCPTGIDIRDGIQLECIGCGLCVDACNNVMDKLNMERGLIRHDTDRNLDLRAKGQAPKYRLVRPRTIVYGMLLAVVSSMMLYALVARDPVVLDIIADRNPLYVTLSDGSVRNGYTLKVINKSHENRTFIITAEGLSNATILKGDMVSSMGDAVTTTHIYVTAPRVGGETRPFNFLLTDLSSGMEVRERATFKGPEK